MEDTIFTENGKIKVTMYTLKLINSNNIEVDEIPFEDVTSIKPVVDKNGKAGLFIGYYDHEFCLNAAVACDEFEIEKTVYKL